MRSEPDPIDGKIVAITGAGSGIGAATATHLADRGATVVLGGRRPERIEAIAASIRSRGGRALAVPTDVTRAADLSNLIATAVRAFGRVDVLVNNAGIAPIGRLDALQVQDWTAMVDINLRGVMHGVAAALPRFRAQGHGHIVTVASLAGLNGVTPSLAVYAATKNAVRTFMEGLRAESTDGIVRTTTISPGFVRTDLADSMDPATGEATRANMDRIGITPEAVARSVAFAIEQPAEVEISNLTITPAQQG